MTKLVNLRYLTGFTGSAGLLLVLADEVVLVTDGRYGQQAAEQVAAAGADVRIEISSTGQREVVAAAVAGAGLAAGQGRLALEADAVTWAQQRTYAESWFPGIELLPTVGLVDDLRLVKDDGEVARIAAAAAIADEALAKVRPRLLEDRPSRTSASSWTSRSADSVPGATRSRRSWPPARTAPSRTIARRSVASSKGISSCSTSGRWSTATAPT